MRTAIVVVLALVAGLVAARVARADVITEEQAECNNKRVGDACGSDGACVTQTCSRNLPDGTRSTWDCLTCVAGAPRMPSTHGDPAASAGPGSSSGSGKGLYIGIAVAVSLIVCGLAFAYTRRKPGPRPGA